jgi:predicted nuclease with TOPRIM domain
LKTAEKLSCICRYKKLEALAQKILAKNPNATDVLDKLKQLKAEQDQMEDMWEKKHKQLTDAKDLQVYFKRFLDEGFV